MPDIATLDNSPTTGRNHIQPLVDDTAEHNWVLYFRILWSRVAEYIKFDAPLLHCVFGTLLYVISIPARLVVGTRKHFSLLSKAHRGNLSPITTRAAERLAMRAASGADARLAGVFESHANSYPTQPRVTRFYESPSRMLGTMAIVLKSALGAERGILVLKYSYCFPLFKSRFDFERIAARYHVVLEPSWSGYCDLDILTFCRSKHPVFVQAYEPRDAAFIRNLHSQLHVIPTSANWWIDHRLFYPRTDVEKEFDVIMVSAWGRYKRHERIFDMLRTLRRDNCRLRMLLIGYPLDLTIDDIKRYAVYYGVADQLEIHENVPYERMNDFLNRARVHLLWSRREGVNRAVIESLLAGLPSVIRQGFNFGYHYPYISQSTGAFATETTLANQLRWAIELSRTSDTRQWVMNNMSCHRATALLTEAIGCVARQRGETFDEYVAEHVNSLHGCQYWDVNDKDRFADDYEFLRNAIIPCPHCKSTK